METVTIEQTQPLIEQTELRSEEVTEILGTVPHWTLRSGSGYLLMLIFLALTISWFVKYPDITSAPIVLTAQTPPVSMMAGSNGHLTLWVKDKEQVHKGQYLGYLNSTARVQDVLDLKNKLDSFTIQFYEQSLGVAAYTFNRQAELGSLKDDFDILCQALANYQLALHQSRFAQQIAAINQQIGSYGVLGQQVQAQNGIMQQELALAKNLYRADSTLYAEQVIAKAEYENRQNSFLKDNRAYKAAEANVTLNSIRIQELELKRNELQLEQQRQHRELLATVEKAMGQLQTQLRAWEQQYMLKAPVDGQVSLFYYWATNQFVKANEEILTIVPPGHQCMGMAKAPVAGSAKLKIGQTVHVKMDNYPVDEYGMLTGTVQTISLLPKENMYNITVELPDSLITSYGKPIDFRQDMTGHAEIVTDNQRLLQRFLYQFRKLFQ